MAMAQLLWGYQSKIMLNPVSKMLQKDKFVHLNLTASSCASHLFPWAACVVTENRELDVFSVP